MYLVTPVKTKTVLDLQATKISKLEATIAQLQAENATLKEMAYVDALTKCFNRRSFDNDIAIEVAKAQRTGDSFTVILIDIDHFKKFNDTKGHQAGDELLTGLASIWKTTIERTTDRVYRTGGEEFVVILSNTTKAGADRVVELIQRGASMMGVTVSMGVADNTEADNEQAIYQLTDERLYQAKGNGRNQASYGFKLAIAA